MKRARVELEPITIEHAARLRRLRALQRLQVSFPSPAAALTSPRRAARTNGPHVRPPPAAAAVQLLTLDQEHRHTSILQRVAQEAVECQARAAADKAAATGGAATTVAAAAVAEASAFARAVQREAREAASSAAHHTLKVRVLTNRHETEQAKAVFQAGSDLKGLKALFEGSSGEAAAGAGGEGGGEEAEAAAAAPAAPVAKPSAAVLAAVAAASSSSAAAPVAGGGTAVCSYCGWRLDKSKQIECYECHRAFCGLGGRGIHSPHGAPCIDIYQCSCKLRRLCHECYDGSAGRSAEAAREWARCGACEAWLCPRELSGTFAGCCRFSGCGTGPLCRACRVAHEKECAEKGKRERGTGDRGGDGYSDEDDDFE